MKKTVAFLIVFTLCISLMSPLTYALDTENEDAKAIAIATSIVSSLPVIKNIENTGLDGIKISENKAVVVSADVHSAGLYNLLFEYFVSDVHGSYIECVVNSEKLNINELSSRLGVTYSLGEVKKDKAGNELTPEWILDDKWQESFLLSNSSFSVSPIELNLTSGAVDFELTVTSGSIYLKSIKLVPVITGISFSDYLQKFDSKNTEVAPIIIGAEDVSSASSTVIMPFCDASTANISPVVDRLQVMNAVGGNAWNIIGQTAEWNFCIKESGWYSFSFAYRQDYTDGRATVRELTIDNQVLFNECKQIEFPYTSNWSVLDLEDEDYGYKFYLEEGDHTLGLTPSLGQFEEVLQDVQDSLIELNSVYRKIIKITSSTPDSYRDYSLDEKIPDTISELNTQAEFLQSCIDKMSDSVNYSLLERLVEQLKELNANPNKIAGQLSNFQSNLTALATWINDQKTQPLALDEIAIYSAGTDYEKEKVGFFKQLFYSIKRFLLSFADEYVTTSSSSGKSIDVWVTTGRDQMQIIRRLISESFTVEKDITVDIRLIDSSALLPAVVAGIGPDVGLGEVNAAPVNFASRGAIYDLTKFKDSKEVFARFADSAITPYKYNDGVYALPETFTFDMMFYRTDIFEEYGWQVPETWDDVKRLVFDLSKNNMQFGLEASFATYCMFLYQNGGAIYLESGEESLLNEKEAISAFKDYTQFYREYKFPLSYNFANRFRSGEMPIAISSYVSYNTLEVFAPDIKGQWDIAAVPGTVNSDGTINHIGVSGGTSCFILGDTQKPNESWEFLKWWTSADIQAKYGNQIENKLGASARYATANLEALGKLPWSESFYKSLTNQVETVKGIPEVPGGYFTSRHFNNAFRAVVYNSKDAQETLIEYVDIIDDEITTKRKEFGLSVKE